jgi:hypothetical protein
VKERAELRVPDTLAAELAALLFADELSRLPRAADGAF